MMPEKNKKNLGKKISNSILYIIFASNLLSLLLLTITRFAWTIPPSEVILFAYLGLAFPIILVVNIIYLIFWIVCQRKIFILVNLLILILNWSTIFTYFPVHTQTSKVPDDCIKILSYNVKSFNWEQGKKATQNPIFDYIKETNADIICMQEFVASFKENNPGNTITEKQVNEILKDYPYRSIVRFGRVHNQYSYGVACYSKFPITKTNRLPLYESTFNGSVAYELDIKGKKITLVNNHLESNKITASDKKLYQDLLVSKDKETLEEVTQNIKARLSVAYSKREKQVDIISDYIAKNKTDGVIVCGDFNDTPISYAYHKMKGDLTDAYAQTGFGHGITYHENKFWFRIDFIMHSSEFKSYNCTVGKVKYSDHYPITAYLQLK